MANLPESPLLTPQDSTNRFKPPFLVLAFPIGVILIGHFMVDTYSAVLQPLLGVVETEFGMKPEWAASLLGIGAVIAGLAQPVFGWISERLNTRIFGALGIVLGAIGISLVGFSPNIPVVFIMFSIGMLGIGMFHPIAAATIGNLAGEKRGLAVSWFFVFGMCGFFVGSLLSPALASGEGGLRQLKYLLIPGIVVAAVLYMAIRKIEIKPKHHSSEHFSMRQYNWKSITILYFTAVFRFTVNLAMIYLLVRWVEHDVAETNPSWTEKRIAGFASPLAGRAFATMIVGQGLGGLIAGWLIVAGKEKWPLVVTPLICAPAIVALAFLGSGMMGYVACFIAGVGFASMTPVTITLGQRLMPHHTTLASGIMLGGAWVIASLGPRIAESLIHNFDIDVAFIVTAAVLALSGVTAMGLNQQTMSASAR